ncbi:MAG: phosphoglucosamine mutase [Acidobacteriota bacterium]
MSSASLFGTDGVRGRFGTPPLDEQTVRRLGAAVGQNLVRRFDRPSVVLGGDTRDSTPELARWLAGELLSQGVELTHLGTVPTPCVADAVVSLDASTGIAVSASHNPHPDNGIKLIDGHGYKWSEQAEGRIEAAMIDEDLPTPGRTLPELAIDHRPVEAYLGRLTASIAGDGKALAGLRIALDPGHGAASALAAPLFEHLGAEVELLHAAPDGANINQDAGSTHPHHVAQRVVDAGCDLGFAFDGDADRAVMADELGNVRDGDAILYLWALDLATRGALPQRRIVATSMSNLGLEAALARHKIGVERCDVGDRAVVDTLRHQRLRLGGEQSGHIIDLERSTTGDGLRTALEMAALRQRAGRPLSEMLSDLERFPQLLRNVPVARKPPLEGLARVAEARREVENALGDQGRLVLRYSGTEPVARIMIEARDGAAIPPLCARLENALLEDIGQ